MTVKPQLPWARHFIFNSIVIGKTNPNNATPNEDLEKQAGRAGIVQRSQFTETEVKVIGVVVDKSCVEQQRGVAECELHTAVAEGSVVFQIGVSVARFFCTLFSSMEKSMRKRYKDLSLKELIEFKMSSRYYFRFAKITRCPYYAFYKSLLQMGRIPDL